MRSRITFIQKNPFINFGILSMAGYLKKYGVESNVISTDLEKDVFRPLAALKPDMIGITCMSTEHTWAMGITRVLRAYLPNTPIILGGVHPTIYADSISSNVQADYICVGEGEKLLVELLRISGSARPDYEGINGLMYKRDGVWVKNTKSCRLSALDWQEDREIYYCRYPAMANDRLKHFLSGRGCYYNCNFCFNDQINSMYGNDGMIVRRKEPHLFISEIEDVVSRYGAETLFFADDIFASNKVWLKEFTPEYKARVGLPFMCTARANMISDEIIKLLRGAGCHTISIGIESGDEDIRRDILGKDVSDDILMRASKLLRDNDIMLQTSNMFVLPGETLKKALKTIDLNIKMGTRFAFASFLMPFPESRIARIAQEMGTLKKDYTFKDMPNSFFTESVLDIPDRRRIENIHAISYWCIRYPWMYPFLRRIIWIRFSALFKAIFLLGLFFRYKEERRIGFFSTAKFFWRFRKSG